MSVLPTFDLNTPGNIEAWNKLRLYLQSAQIKSSRFLQVCAPRSQRIATINHNSNGYRLRIGKTFAQVSVLWCFGAVVAMSIVKIIQMAVVQQQRANNPTDELHCNQFFTNETNADRCSTLSGCYWNNSKPYGQNKCSTVSCLLLNHDECGAKNLQHYCKWDQDVDECKDLAQRF